jgi:hypothetical protein
VSKRRAILEKVVAQADPVTHSGKADRKTGTDLINYRIDLSEAEFDSGATLYKISISVLIQPNKRFLG